MKIYALLPYRRMRIGCKNHRNGKFFCKVPMGPSPVKNVFREEKRSICLFSSLDYQWKSRNIVKREIENPPGLNIGSTYTCLRYNFEWTSFGLGLAIWIKKKIDFGLPKPQKKGGWKMNQRNIFEATKQITPLADLWWLFTFLRFTCFPKNGHSKWVISQFFIRPPI